MTGKEKTGRDMGDMARDGAVLYAQGKAGETGERRGGGREALGLEAGGGVGTRLGPEMQCRRAGKGGAASMEALLRAGMDGDGGRRLERVHGGGMAAWQHGSTEQTRRDPNMEVPSSWLDWDSAVGRLAGCLSDRVSVLLS